jgi:pimeloyl-ACP methyl ester carboxylesterase
LRTLFVIGAAATELGRAEPLLARGRRIVALSPATDEALARAIAAAAGDTVDLLARHDGAGAGLRVAAHLPERIGALVLESPPPAESFAALLPQLALPVLVLYGTADAHATDLGRGYKALLPNGWFMMVYAAGRDIARDRPEAYAELVGDFLNRGVRFTISEQSSRINP